MTFEINEPTQKISKKAVIVWRIHSFFKNSVVLLVLGVLLFLSYKFSWFYWISFILYVLISFVILLMIYDLAIHPVYLQRTWRYDINEHIVQLKYGFFQRHHIIIPMSRVEYVNAHQGPLLRRYHLSSITIGTIASQHEIPALNEEEANALRNEIVSLAQIGLIEQEQQSKDNEENQSLT